ncbi:hypothetical protein [Amnibacterium endophyticum]|uniref:DUF7847 domain-containing protein n=1 Tax=Amnibacterium endophyticum TaxID=2109337 RepID=A0ABW4L982_9MICO
MTDGTSGWASPSGGREEPPRYGERVPGWQPPEAAPPPPAPSAYRPPPKRGLIPLHPLSFGQLLGAAFGLIRWNPRATVVPALAVSVLQTALVFGGIAGLGLTSLDRFQRAATDADRAQILAGTIGGGVLFGLLTFAVTILTTALLQGLLVTVVARAALGERIALGAALRIAWRRVLPLIGVALLLGVAQVVAIGLLVLLVALVAQAGDTGPIIAALVGVLGGLGFIAAYLFIAIKVATVPSAVVLERLGVLAAIRRSWTLLRGSFWRTLGLVALVTVMVGIAAQVVSIPFSIIGGAVGGLLAPNAGGDLENASALGTLLLTSLPATIVGVIVQGVGQVAQVGVLGLVYLDQRMRREGLDLAMQRAVEEDGADPFSTAR